VDVGANIGTTVLPAARQVGPTGRVIAVEPASRVGNLLRRSILINGLQDRISLHACAGGEAEGRAELNLGPITGHSSLLGLPEANRTESVEVRPLDDLVEPGQAIRLVKLDAEGFELRIRRGMGRIIADNPALAVLVEFGPTHLDRAGVSVESWLAEMLAPDFTAYEVDESDVSLRPLRAKAELRAVFSVNLLLLRQPPTAFPALRFT
jgi:FkbM family methyltransferase